MLLISMFGFSYSKKGVGDKIISYSHYGRFLILYILIEGKCWSFFFYFILSQLSNCIRAFKMRCSIKEREFLKRFKKKKKKKKKCIEG